MWSLDFSLQAVDRASAMSITQQIVELIRKNVEMQILLPGDKLPTERELAEHLGIARGTVKTAYKRLEQNNVIRTRQGSGSFVIRDEELARRLRKENAVAIINDTITRLTGLGLGLQAMSQLFDACLSQISDQQLVIAVVCDTPELLLDFKRQLSFLAGVTVSIFILQSITENHDPEGLLHGCDIIVTPSRHYASITSLLPNLAHRVIEAAVSPSAETVIQLTSLPRKARIGIICSSSAFLAIVKENLLSYGFSGENILSFFEMDYTIETYFPGGINVLISFGNAHIFTNPAFTFRNEEFWDKGGKIIAFRHQIERGTLIYIEDKIRKMLAQRTPSPPRLTHESNSRKL